MLSGWAGTAGADMYTCSTGGAHSVTRVKLIQGYIWVLFSVCGGAQHKCVCVWTDMSKGTSDTDAKVQFPLLRPLSPLNIQAFNRKTLFFPIYNHHF